MARLADVPKVFRSVGVIAFARRVWHQVEEDKLFTWAAALAYSWMFAVFPFLLFLLSLIPYLPRQFRNGAHKAIKDGLYNVQMLPVQAADTIWKNIEGNLNNLLHQPRGLVLYLGLIVALWASSSGMHSTMSALDRCYELERGRPYYHQRLLAIGLTIIVVVFLLVVTCLLPIASALRRWIVAEGVFPSHGLTLVTFDIARWLLAVLIILAVVGLIYYLGPSVKHHFNLITPGALFCAIVWIGLGFGLRFYIDAIGEKGYEKIYGALGGVAVLLLFFYLDALVLLIGAEINSEIDFEVLKVRRGTRDLRKAEELDAATPTAL